MLKRSLHYQLAAHYADLTAVCTHTFHGCWAVQTPAALKFNRQSKARVLKFGNKRTVSQRRSSWGHIKKSRLWFVVYSTLFSKHVKLLCFRVVSCRQITLYNPVGSDNRTEAVTAIWTIWFCFRLTGVFYPSVPIQYKSIFPTYLCATLTLLRPLVLQLHFLTKAVHLSSFWCRTLRQQESRWI